MFLSAFIFALPHFEIFGKIMMALVMTILYLKTRSLLLSIFCHSINNSIALLALYFLENTGNDSNDIPKEFWLQGFLVLIISITYLIFFMKKYWPNKQTKIPLMDNELISVEKKNEGELI